MINLVAFTIAAVVWLVLWAIGAKAIDAALVSVAIIVGAAAVYTYRPLVRRTLGLDDE